VLEYVFEMLDVMDGVYNSLKSGLLMRAVGLVFAPVMMVKRMKKIFVPALVLVLIPDVKKRRHFFDLLVESS